MKRDRGVGGNSLLSLRWSTRQSRVDCRHTIGSPEALWSIFSKLRPLSYVVNVSVKNVAPWSSSSMDVSAKTLRPQMNAMSSRRKDMISDLDPGYSPRQRRKKFAIIIMSHSP